MPKHKLSAASLTPVCHGTHLQEGEDLLLLGPVHIPFLEELEVGDEATTWPDIPARGGWAGSCATGSSQCCTPSSVLLGVTASRSLYTRCLAEDPSPAGGGRCPAAPTTVLTSEQGGSLSSGRVPAFRIGWKGSPGRRAHRAPARFVVHSVLCVSRAGVGYGGLDSPTQLH